MTTLTWPEALRAYLACAECSQAEFAAAIGCGTSTLERWIAGEMHPGAKHVGAVILLLQSAGIDNLDTLPAPVTRGDVDPHHVNAKRANKKTIAPHWGDIISRIAKRRGMSPTAYGRSIGASRQAISQWRNGQRYPEPSFARRILTDNAADDLTELPRSKRP